MEGVSFAERKLPASGNKIRALLICALVACNYLYAQEVKEPNVAGSFYPADPKELSQMIDRFLSNAKPPAVEGDIFALISPHAGYGYSGQTAAFGYKLIQGRPYKTVVVIGLSHQYAFSGISVYPLGAFRTPLGDVEVDKDFTEKLLNKDPEIFFEPRAFEEEHSVEVQLPFLQKVLSDFKIVAVVMGETDFLSSKKLAALLKEAIGNRKDVLVVDSVDMYHGYDFAAADNVDKMTASYILNMDEQGLYDGLLEGKLNLCGRGGMSVVTTLILAKELGHKDTKLLKHTNSAEVTGKKTKGTWTVGYGSFVIDQKKGEMAMLNKEQRKKLLQIARNSIEAYLKTGKKLELHEKDPVLLKEMGAFVTLHKRGELRGCIGNLVGQEALYLTIRDMAVEAAVADPRFPPVKLDELQGIEIEISALSPLERIKSADEIKLGVHGVLVRRGFNNGVFLPQVATETGWSKEEFLANLCSHKAGLSPDAWKDKTTEVFIFTAEVFSEKEINSRD